mmetsp:Transcript_6367/g.8049  ORF Transcript_6367/g.8049 Transcript_6367/m.8049 type:complete len:121 (-) Transcript_6367:717-1079(-)|eukprot:CAMPEP_0204846584 /NCGR_PEP_ID=MMETSP1347-20130617/2105_1 /ASSEMBLY_ACC=CAM_ASM_000690 /TAXON_ID=215587 /ORGANISM="Aplanochytrium stocchinoi, Strain GSBS06" /LENGTH=120 /DNA_ID=CAMNT_0051987215 /DNA_START=189 /DNA_END=551 /DNA_ORIENTATION=-
MFKSSLSLAARAVRARHMSTAAESFPKKGQSHGGHPDVLQKEGNYVKNWLSDAGAYPVIFITGFACLFASYKLAIVDAGAPDTHWDKQTRSTLDYIENNRDPNRAIQWGNTMFHRGPAKN